MNNNNDNKDLNTQAESELKTGDSLDKVKQTAGIASKKIVGGEDVKSEPANTLPIGSSAVVSEPKSSKANFFKKFKLRGSKKSILVAGATLSVLLLAIGFLSYSDVDNNKVAVNGAQEAKVYKQGAALTEVNGVVEYNNGSGWKVVETGTSLEQSHQVKTGADSRAIITLDDGSAIRLNGNTTVTLGELTTTTVMVKNEGGQLYTRVSPSENRDFVVFIDEDPYLALGTAYKTVNEDAQKGVEVYHSKVKVIDKTKTDLEIAEGQAMYSVYPDKEQVKKVVKLDIEKLKDDEFLKWNKQQDEKDKEYADKLGFIKNIDDPKSGEPKPEPAPATPAPITQNSTVANGISAWGSNAGNGIKVSWSVKGVDTSKGYKIAYSTKDTTPRYGENSAKYVSPGESSKVLSLTDGKTWHIRVCAYRGNGACDSYSNTISVTAPYKEKAKVSRGSMSANMDGNVIYWSYSGSAIYGYKVVWNTSGNPTYPASGTNGGYKYISNPRITAFDLPEKIGQPSGNYKVKVCAYTAGTESEKCVDYSNNVTY